MASVPSAFVGGMSLAFTTASEFFSISSFSRSRFGMNSWESIGAYRMSREDGQKKRRVQSGVSHKVLAQFSPGLLRRAMKQMHHSLSEITVPAAALKGFAATNQLTFRPAPKAFHHRVARQGLSLQGNRRPARPAQCTQACRCQIRCPFL